MKRRYAPGLMVLAVFIPTLPSLTEAAPRKPTLAERIAALDGKPVAKDACCRPCATAK